MWYDATSAAGYLSDPETSEVADKVGFAYGPTAVTPRGAHWLWAWALGIESSSRKQDAAFEFIKWATSKEYINLVGEELGWVRVPPGTRRSTYESDTGSGPGGRGKALANALEYSHPADTRRYRFDGDVVRALRLE
jgi:sorbitol/mannitol transport system substrate-binding protein